MIRLVTGGSGSGKSGFAEDLAAACSGDKYYIATMRVWDGEGRRRIERHREMRAGKGFKTIEAPVGLENIDIAPGVALIEDASNLMMNEMYERSGDGDSVAQTIFALHEKCGDVIVVTNEVFSDGIAYPDETDVFLRHLGRLNRTLAGAADEVHEVVLSVPVRIK